MTDRDADIVRDGLAIGKRAVATGVLAGCRADWFDRPNAALDRLVAERDAAIEAAFTCVGHAEEVEAERDRLRAAIKDFHEWAPGWAEDSFAPASWRAALAGEDT